jgi:hypothetical protein
VRLILCFLRPGDSDVSYLSKALRYPWRLPLLEHGWGLASHLPFVPPGGLRVAPSTLVRDLMEERVVLLLRRSRKKRRKNPLRLLTNWCRIVTWDDSPS